MEVNLEFENLLPKTEEVEKNTKTELVKKVIPITEDSSPNNQEGPWLWNGSPIQEIDLKQYKCFVYLITNKVTGKRYVGFKTTVSKKTRVEKGKRKHYEAESDWKTYWSSSDTLKSDVNQFGKGNFLREIIALCPLKGVGKYIELQEQIERRVLTENKPLYYNGIINLRIGGNAVGRWKQVKFCDSNLGDDLAESIISSNV